MKNTFKWREITFKLIKQWFIKCHLKICYWSVNKWDITPGHFDGGWDVEIDRSEWRHRQGWEGQS
jgi:hypothetical protein